MTVYRDDGRGGSPAAVGRIDAVENRALGVLFRDLKAETSWRRGPEAEAAEAALELWLGELMTSAAWAHAANSQSVLSVVGEFIADASVTEAEIAKIEARRRLLEEERNLRKSSAKGLDFSSPGKLLASLRLRAEVGRPDAAATLRVSDETLAEIESQRAPWYQLDVSTLPNFAQCVGEPIHRILAMIAASAKAALFAGIDRRARSSLARSDRVSEGAAGRDRLRMAFASVEEENRAGAQFLILAAAFVLQMQQTKRGD